jgi:RNA polymerase sigma factor (TIGR02999 family)
METGDISQQLKAAAAGDARAAEQVLPLIYAELRALAHARMSHERRDHTLQATALVHEAYMRLAKDTDLSFQNRAHLLGIAARAMREILIEHARARGARKRGGHEIRVTLDDNVVAPGGDVDMLVLHGALEKLAALDERQARIVELRFFGGLTIEEAAEVLAVAPATVKRDWAVARAWLYREVAGQ